MGGGRQLEHVGLHDVCPAKQLGISDKSEKVSLKISCQFAPFLKSSPL